MSGPSRAAAERERRERLRRNRERQRSVQVPAAPVRQRREGLVGWTVRMVRAVPAGSAAAVRGVAQEVIGIFVALGRSVVRAVPGGARLLELRAHPRDGASADSKTTRSRPIGTDLPVERVRGRSPEEQARNARRRQLLRRRIRFGVLGAVLVALVVGAIVVPGSSAFRIRHVEVIGASSVSDLAVRDRIGRLLDGETIYTVDAAAVEREIAELPFVESARVERHFPGGLGVSITEYRPLALALGDGASWLVSRDGRILAKAEREDWHERVPVVRLRSDDLRVGARVSDEPALQLLDGLPATSTLTFELIELSGKDLVGRLTSGVEVRFGRPRGVENLRAKVFVAQVALEYARDRAKQEVRYIDVSVPERPATCYVSDVRCGPVAAAKAFGPATANGASDGTTAAATPVASAASG